MSQRHAVYRLELNGIVVYVGRSIRPQKRLTDARNRYQLPSLVLGSVEWFDEFKDAQRRELELIDDISPSLNKRRISSPGHLGLRQSPETQAKISAIWHSTHSTEHIEQLRTARVGVAHSAETRKKMSLTRRGRPRAPEHSAKIIAANTGRKFTPEHCAAISAAKKAKNAERRSHAL